MPRAVSLHPFSCCLAAFVLALYLTWQPLHIVSSLLMLAALWPPARQQLWLALRRMRWLLLAMLLLSAWTLPGVPLWPSAHAPSVPGLQAGARQALGVLLLALLARGLWLWQGQQGMLAASLPLDALLSRLGMPAGRLALRLTLTLQYANHLLEQPRRPRLAALASYLRAPPMAQGAPDKVQLPLYPWTKWDGVLLAGLLMAVVMKVVA